MYWMLQSILKRSGVIRGLRPSLSMQIGLPAVVRQHPMQSRTRLMLSALSKFQAFVSSFGFDPPLWHYTKVASIRQLGSGKRLEQTHTTAGPKLWGYTYQSSFLTTTCLQMNVIH
jgi:hypothetical protein